MSLSSSTNINMSNHWRRVQDKQSTAFSKAESLRHTICDCSYNNSAEHNVPQDSRLPGSCFAHHLHDTYSQLVCDETSSGLNNFADSVLPMIANQRNESDSWRSSITMDWIQAEGLLDPAPPVPDLSGIIMPVCKPKQGLVPYHQPAPATVSQAPELGKRQPSAPTDAFRSAREQMAIDCAQKNKQNPLAGQAKKSLGPRRGVGKFVSPVTGVDNSREETSITKKAMKAVHGGGGTVDSSDIELPEELSHLDPKLVELIMNEIMETGKLLQWTDIAGLEFAKKTIKEIIVLPMLRPDIFTGLRGPPKGMLLFGPPGTGKTLIGKCVASQSKCTFFSISASSLTSKWVGEGEKMVRALFAVARYKQPAVVFIDEIDSLLTQRSESEHESSRRIKTEFLVQMDGVGCDSEDRILIIGATNRPQELDEAARRRFVKRLYIPLPEAAARQNIIERLLTPQTSSLSRDDVDLITKRTEGYSGADMANLCKESALGPVREIAMEDIETVTLDQVRPININDMLAALKQVRASVSTDDLDLYLDWNAKFGSWNIPKC